MERKKSRQSSNHHSIPILIINGIIVTDQFPQHPQLSEKALWDKKKKIPKYKLTKCVVLLSHSLEMNNDLLSFNLLPPPKTPEELI